MKLAGQEGEVWSYRLSTGEAAGLCALVSQFPIATVISAKISRVDADPKAVEREKLLNESLAEHRAELKRRIAGVVSPGKFKTSGKSRLFQINSEEREILLQVLNDIRIESWHLLGEPDELELNAEKLAEPEHRCWHCMHLAGYFQYHLLGE